MAEKQQGPEQSPDVYPMNVATLANFNEMQQNVADSLGLIVRNSGNPNVRAEAQALLDKLHANIAKASEWIAARQ